MSRGIEHDDQEEGGSTEEALLSAVEEYQHGFVSSDLVEMTHEFIEDYVLAVDQKASFLMTGLIGIIGLGANFVSVRGLSIEEPVLISLSLAATFGTLGIIFCGWVVYPRVYPPHNPGFIYWERIRQFGSRENFITAVEELDKEQAMKEISKNVYNTSDIASRKYGWLRWAMISTLLMFYFAGIAGLITFGSHPILAILFPTMMIVSLYFGLFAESQQKIAQSTATFETTGSGNLQLFFETDEGSNINIEFADTQAECVVEVNDINQSDNLVTIINKNETEPQTLVTLAVGFVGYTIAVIGSGYLTGNWPLAVSGLTFIGGLMLAGYISGQKGNINQYRASFESNGRRSMRFYVRSLATQGNMGVTMSDDTNGVTFNGLPPNNIVHVTDPDKTPYDMFQD